MCCGYKAGFETTSTNEGRGARTRLSLGWVTGPPLPTALQSFLDALPAGLDSYPQAVAKASILRTFLAKTDATKGWAGDLPAPLPALVEAPPPDSAWVLEAHCHGVYLAARDLLFPTDTSYIAHWRAVNESIVTGKLYRAIFALISPARVLTGTGSRWGRLHDGIELLVEAESNSAELIMKYPRGLVPELLAQSYTTAFDGVLRASGGRRVEVVLSEFTSRTASYRATWS